MPSVVDIKVIAEIRNPFSGEMEKRQYGGSGVYVNPKGYILTCGHLFNFAKIISISITNIKGETVAGQLLQVNFVRDLALVKTTFYDKTPFVKLVDPRDVLVGQEVIAIGSPAGLEFTVTSGIISQMHRDVDSMYNTLQHSASINPGNSGGPLFNLKGELVGINSFYVPVSPFMPVYTGLGFAVSPSECLTFLVSCGKDIPGIRSYKWLHTLLS